MTIKALSNKELLDELTAAVQALRAEYVPISTVEQYSAIIAEIARRLDQLNKIKILLDR